MITLPGGGTEAGPGGGDAASRHSPYSSASPCLEISESMEKYHQGSLGDGGNTRRCKSAVKINAERGTSAGNENEGFVGFGSRVDAVSEIDGRNRESSGGETDGKVNRGTISFRTKEGEIVCRHNVIEQMCIKDADSNGIIEGCKKSLDLSNVGNQTGPVEILLVSDDKTVAQEILSIQDGREHVAMEGIAIRFQEFNADNGETNKTAEGEVARDGDISHRLGRRFRPAASQGLFDSDAESASSLSVDRESRIRNKQGKVASRTCFQFPVPRFYLGPTLIHCDGRGTSNSEYQKQGESIRSESGFEEGTGQVDRRNSIHCPGSERRNSLDGRVRARKEGSKRMGRVYITDGSVKNRTQILEEVQGYDADSDSPNSKSSRDNNGGCRTERICICREQSVVCGIVESHREVAEYELEGASSVGEDNVNSIASVQDSQSNLSHRLDGGSGVHSENLWEVAGIVENSCIHMEIGDCGQHFVRSEGDKPASDLHGGQIIENRGSQDVDFGSTGVQQSMLQTSDNAHDRRDGIIDLIQITKVLCEGRRTRSFRSERVQSGLGSRGNLCVSSTTSDTQDPGQVDRRSPQCAVNTSSVEANAMDVDSQEQNNGVNVSSRAHGNADRRGMFTFSVQSFQDRDPLGTLGLCTEAIKIAKKGVVASTAKRKVKVIDLLLKYINSLGKSEFNEIDILNFLALEFARNRSFDYANNRSAICSTINERFGINLTKSALFAKSMFGARKLRPIEPKYDEMWDATIMFGFLEKDDFWREKSHIRARVRANILTRLSVAGRNKDVARIDRNSMVWSMNEVKFRFYGWKGQRFDGRRFSNYIVIRKLPIEHRNICAFSALETYMSIHKSDYERVESMGIWMNYSGSSEISHHTLASDVRKIMICANIPIEYGAATLRHAAITFWRSKGISLAEVMKRTGHRSEALVRKYYDRSGAENDLMASIWSGELDSSSDEECVFSEGEQDTTAQTFDNGGHVQ